jgi:NAD(P)-dependent dehydrogenase (short-subunit alcohol dehydrogenase family)
MKLSGRAAIVTGSRRSIGKAIAVALSREGANVVISDIDLDDCQAVVKEIEAAGGKALAIKCDVSVKAEVQDMVAQTIAAFGKVDILVHNAMYTVIKPFWRVTEEEWDRVMDVNLKGAFLCSQAVTKNMIKNQWGRIVNIASVSSGGGGGGGASAPLLTAYTASKGGMKALSQSMAVELANFGINVNAICPGPIDTGALPDSIKNRGLKSTLVGRLGHPEDIASMVVYLCSPEADFITGSNVVVDGGASNL